MPMQTPSTSPRQMLSKLRIRQWRQFESIDIAFHNRLTVLTGANGAGKTTLLNLLARHYRAWPGGYLATPIREKTGRLKYFCDSWFTPIAQEPTRIIGEEEYSDGTVSILHVPLNVHYQYEIEYRPMVHVQGIHIPSHRPVYQYQMVGTLPTQPLSRQEAYQKYSNAYTQRHFGTTNNVATPQYTIKETLMALAAFGYGNQVVDRNEASVAAFEDFQKILKQVLPASLGFESISIRMPDVVLVTRSGEFSLDASSGGISSIIDLAWQIFTYSHDKEHFIVTLDEPENHLHPEMQQALLPRFIDAFPTAQFIVATHSPFVVTAVQDAHIHVLRYNSENKVESTLISQSSRAGTANEILREVLGMSFTIPLWAERRLRELTEKYTKQSVTTESLNELRAELVSLGLSEQVPAAIAKVVAGALP